MNWFIVGFQFAAGVAAFAGGVMLLGGLLGLLIDRIERRRWARRLADEP